MKKSLTLALALTALAVFINPSMAQGAQQKGNQKSPPTSGQTHGTRRHFSDRDRSCRLFSAKTLNTNLLGDVAGTTSRTFLRKKEDVEMSKKLISCFVSLIFVSSLLTGGIVFSQKTNPPARQPQNPSLGVVSPGVRTKLDGGDRKLRQTQSVLANIERKKRLNELDADAVEKTMFAYAEELKTAYEEATREAEKAAKSEGREGGVASLKTFEEKAKAQEAVVNQIEARTKAIETKIQRREIVVDQPLQKRTSQTEREELRRFLEAEERNLSDEPQPAMFMTQRVSLDSFGAASEALYAGQFPGPFAEASSSFNAVSMAIPSVAAPCVSPCAAKKWGECLACIVAAGPTAIEAWNNFVKCWNGASGWWKWFKRAVCLARFVSVLA
jgi:hypothetical protein